MLTKEELTVEEIGKRLGRVKEHLLENLAKTGAVCDEKAITSTPTSVRLTFESRYIHTEPEIKETPQVEVVVKYNLEGIGRENEVIISFPLALQEPVLTREGMKGGLGILDSLQGWRSQFCKKYGGIVSNFRGNKAFRDEERNCAICYELSVKREVYEC